MDRVHVHNIFQTNFGEFFIERCFHEQTRCTQSIPVNSLFHTFSKLQKIAKLTLFPFIHFLSEMYIVWSTNQEHLLSTTAVVSKWRETTKLTPIPSIRDRVLCRGMLLYLHLINFKIFFHPAKFDNFKDETISDYKTVPQSQILAGLKTLGLVGL